MPLRSEMSVAGLYAYDSTIFDRMHVPEVYAGGQWVPYVDRDIIVQSIIQETMDLEILYPDPVYMKEAIRVWSLTMRNSWDRIAKALYEEYAPLENYNRTESWTDTNSRTENWTDGNTRSTSDTETISRTMSGTDKQTRTDNLTEKNTGSMTGSGSVTETTGGNKTISKKGYNSAGWMAGEKEDTTGSLNNTTTDSTTTSNTRTNTGTQKNDVTRNETDTGSNTRTGSITDSGSKNGTIGDNGSRTGNVHGNIGVMSSQNMLTQEMQVRLEYQLTHIIVNQFKTKFCLLVY